VSPAGERASLGGRLAAEAVGTALLLAAVVGSEIMGERLAGGNGAVALMLAFGPISGAHFGIAGVGAVVSVVLLHRTPAGAR